MGIVFPVGTKVKIQSKEWFYRDNPHGDSIRKQGYGYFFIKDMTLLEGQVATITRIYTDDKGNTVYDLNKGMSNWGWHDWMFDVVDCQLGIL